MKSNEFLNEEDEVLTDVDGNRRWLTNGKLHRDGDEPAYIFANGDKEWYKNGKKHRDGDKPAKITHFNAQYWFINDKLHRDGDKPALIRPNGEKQWRQHGVLHRDGDKPAEITNYGTQRWYKNGKTHRDGDKPAVISRHGDQDWFINGQHHRDGDKPAVISRHGDQYWYKNGKLGRDGDKPAGIKADGEKEWFMNGLRHRKNGPAIIRANGEKLYFFQGRKVKEEELKPADDHLSSFIKIFADIKRDCQPYLKQNPKALTPQFRLLRGWGSSKPIIANDVNLDYRLPLTTKTEIHDATNTYFTEKFGEPFRNSVFVTSNKKIADFYGNVYIIFPKGDFTFLWSPKIEDFWDDAIHLIHSKTEFEGEPEELIDDIIALRKFIDSVHYQTTELMSGIQSGNEIMLRCESYYGILLSAFEEFFDSDNFVNLLYSKGEQLK